jgi:regulator of protease activity HflC (stomatin/prohibitin superfamily)
MFFIKRIKIRSDEVGLYFRDREFIGLLNAGTHWLSDPLGRVSVQTESLRNPWLVHEKLDLIVKSGKLDGRAVLDLKDYERALVWIDGRFSHVLPRGLYAYWTSHREVAVEVIDARKVRFEHRDLAMIVRSQGSDRVLEVVNVAAGHAGIVFLDGVYAETLSAGQYAYWKNVVSVKVVPIDLRESMFDIAGQEIMTADKVTLRLNVAVVYRVVDARVAVSMTEDARQSLYREVQLALRAAVVARELDAFLADKDAVAQQIEEAIAQRAASLGLEVASVGIRDIILPGDMKELMNKVTEAKKAAEANLIVRREETAAMRSQSNTAKLLEGNPTLMRLRELEVLEKIASAGKLNIVLGEKGLAERVVNLL